MPLTEEIISKYFVNNLDQAEFIPGESVPTTTENNEVEYFIDGKNYFKAISDEINSLKEDGLDGSFFYFTGHWLGLVDAPIETESGEPYYGVYALRLDNGCTPNGGSNTMIDLLDDLNSNGVDVRALGWAAPLMLNRDVNGMLLGSPINPYVVATTNNLLTIADLRNRGIKAVLNTLSPPLASWHMKMVVLGNSYRTCAYMGGMDFVCNRYSQMTHPLNNNWHDVAVKIEGPAVEEIYDTFKKVWNEQIQRPPVEFMYQHSDSPFINILSHDVNSYNVVEDYPNPSEPISGTKMVQLLRTIPKISIPFPSFEWIRNLVNFDTFERIMLLWQGNQPLTFAPDGLFEFRAGLRKAIKAAQNFIYIEDQGFFGVEIMEWINERLKKAIEDGLDLKIILLWGPDLSDPGNPFLGPSIETLTRELTEDKIATHVVFHQYHGVTVHSKLFIIDDMWTSIGSANCYRRSLYSDSEISVSILDEDSPSFAKRLRNAIWGEHCELIITDPNIDIDINIWFSASSTVGTGHKLKEHIKKKDIPFRYKVQPADNEVDEKFDTSKTWCGLLNIPMMYDLAYNLIDTDLRLDISG